VYLQGHLNFVISFFRFRIRKGQQVSVSFSQKAQSPCLSPVENLSIPVNRGNGVSLRGYAKRENQAGCHLQRTGDTMAPSFFNSAKALSTSLRSIPVISAILPALTGAPNSRMACNTFSFIILLVDLGVSRLGELFGKVTAYRW